MKKVEFESILFLCVEYIKKFNNYMIVEFKLSDIPYNVAGKSFPKHGFVSIEDERVEYRFHGRGCTLLWNGLHIFFNVDATSVHNIIITPGGWHCFLETYLADYEEKGYSSLIENILEELEDRGIFMKRKPSDLGTFHVNERWFESYKNNLPFSGENRNEIDWL